MQLKLAFIGFGNVAREFARLLASRQTLLNEIYGVQWRTTGIATHRHGSIITDSDIDLMEATERVERHHQLSGISDITEITDAEELIQRADADIIFETTPLSPLDGEPATTYIRAALRLGIHVITANKGPIACAYHELQSLAEKQAAKFHFEGTVMDGTPIFNLHRFGLPATEILGFSGVLNSTTNVILSAMEAGSTFAEGLLEAQQLGVAEANADYDIDGWDAGVKAIALANVLMNAELHPRNLSPTGIREVTLKAVQSARAAGKTIRLIARAERRGEKVEIQVAPEITNVGSLFATLQGTSSALSITTDLMGEISLVEHHPKLRQTAYALLSDMLSIHRQLSGKF
ncbi:MAG: homoserine dehydrogenase [Acidobacteriota bacterium]